MFIEKYLAKTISPENKSLFQYFNHKCLYETEAG